MESFRFETLLTAGSILIIASVLLLLLFEYIIGGSTSNAGFTQPELCELPVESKESLSHRAAILLICEQLLVFLKELFLLLVFLLIIVISALYFNSSDVCVLFKSSVFPSSCSASKSSSSFACTSRCDFAKFINTFEIFFILIYFNIFKKKNTWSRVVCDTE